MLRWTNSQIASTTDELESYDDPWESLAYRDHGLEIIEKINEGGEGEIYKAVQTTVERTVAVKVLKDRLRDEFGTAALFLEGARIGARLQHPGILPVYQVGRFGDRPFFTMRLIDQGRRFSDVLSTSPRPPQNQLIVIYNYICQTVSYAHEKGIAHLDLNPANVMIGDHGEVLVIDWGLAKQRDSWSGPERWVRGTPSYAAPEQLAGGAEVLDQRCDVFALGAILCQILIGRPPYVLAQGEKQREQVETGLAGVRAEINASGADPELVALTAACLALDPSQRPSNASDVARRIEDYQATQQTRHEEAKKARWKAQQNVKWVVGSSVFILMLIVLGVLGRNAFEARRARAEADAAGKIDELLTKANLDLSQGKITDAQAETREAAGRLDALSQPLRQAYDQRVADITMLASLWRIRHPSSADEWTARGRNAQVADSYGRAFRDYGVDTENSDRTVERIKRSAIQPQLVVALDDWAETTKDVARRNRLRAVADQADPHPDGLLGQIRRAKRERNTKLLKELAATEKVRALPPQILASLSVWLRNNGAIPEAIALLRDAWKRHSGEFWIDLELGTNLALAARAPAAAAEATAYLTAALALSNRSPLVHTYLGIIQYDFGMFQRAAAAAYREAIQIDPRYAPAYCNLGNALTAVGKFDEAFAAFQDAIRIEPDFALAYFNMGGLFDTQGRFEEAAAAYREAIRRDPDYGEAYVNLASDEFNLGKFVAADEDYGRGLERIAPLDPSRAVFEKQQELSRAFAEVEPKLPDVQAGRSRPSSVVEALNLARLCAHRTRLDHPVAAKLFHQAFQEKPELVDDPVMGDRYAAAATAAAASATPTLAAKERAEVRGWALDWLRAELAIRGREIRGAVESIREDSRRKLNFWLQDARLVTVQDANAPADLPIQERKAWSELWDRVRTLIQTPGRPR